MKKLSILLLLIISLGCRAQTKQDTLLQKKQDSAVNKIITTTPVKELQVFFYKNLTAEKYEEFLQYYREFIITKLKEKK